MDAFIEHLRVVRHCSPHTLGAYSSDVAGFLRFADDAGAPIDALLVRRYLAHLQNVGNAKSSLARKVAALRAFFKYLVRREVIETDPTEGIRPPSQSRKLPKVVPEDLIGSLMAAPDSSGPTGLRDIAIMETLYSTGLRISELLSLTPDQVDSRSDEITVIGKRDKERIVFLGSKARSLSLIHI